MSTEVKVMKFVGWAWVTIALVVILTSCTGRVPKSLMNEATATAAPPTAAARPIAANAVTPLPSCRVVGESVYIRSGGGMQYPPVTVARKGQRLDILGAGAWLNVSTYGRQTVGFIYGKYCQ